MSDPHPDSDAFYLMACAIIRDLTTRTKEQVAAAYGVSAETVEGIVSGQFCPAARKHMIVEGWITK